MLQMSSETPGTQGQPKFESAPLSFRPQRPTKKTPQAATQTVVPQTTLPSAPPEPSSEPSSEPSLLKETPHEPFIERETDINQHIYTRSWLYSHRLAENVVPSKESVERMKESQVWRHSHQNSSNGSGPVIGSIQREQREHRDRRGSSGPRNHRSGSGRRSSSNQPPNTSLESMMVSNSNQTESLQVMLNSNSSSNLNGSNQQQKDLFNHNHSSNNMNSNISSNTTPIKSRGYSIGSPSISPSSSSNSLNSTSDSPSRRDGLVKPGSGRYILMAKTESEKFVKELTGLLNKLTIEKFDSLSNQISKKFDEITSAEMLGEAIKVLHTKALIEHSFCPMYADLVKSLDRIYPFEEKDANAHSSASTLPTSSASTLPTSFTTPPPLSSSRLSTLSPTTLSPSTSSASLSSPLSPTMPTTTTPTTTTPSISSPYNASTVPNSSSNIPIVVHSRSHSPRSSSSHSASLFSSSPSSSSFGSFLSPNSPASTDSSLISRSISPARTRVGSTGSASSSSSKSRPTPLLRKLLLNNCYYVWQEALEKKTNLIGEDEVTLKARYRINGNMIFMGELYKRGLFPFKILKASADGLVTSIKTSLASHSSEAIAQCEPHCIMLYHLIKTVGESFDKEPKGKVSFGPASSTSSDSTRAILDGYMDSMKDFASSKLLRSRVKFLLRDVIDDRLNNWTPRRRVDAPMKLEEVRELHDADLINPLHPNMGRISVPTSEYDDRHKQIVSPSPGSGKRPKERSGSGTRKDLQGAHTRKGSSGPHPSTLASTPPTTPQNYLPPSPSTPTLPETREIFPASLVEAHFEGNEDGLIRFLNSRPAYRSSVFVFETINWIIDQKRDVQAKLVPLLSFLMQRGLLAGPEIPSGFIEFVSNLSDIIVDVPHAPMLIGKQLNQAINEKLLTSDDLQRIYAACPTQKFKETIATEIQAK